MWHTVRGSDPLSPIRSQLHRPPLELLTYNPELLNLLATVFGNINVALGIHGDAVWLVEFTREVSGTAETRQNLAALTIDDFDLRVVLVDEVDEPLV